MADASDDDMTRPVTRGGMKQEFADFEKRFEAKLDAKLDAKLEVLLGAIFARLDQRFVEFRIEFREELRAEIDKDIARHTSAMAENLRTLIVALDDKYEDLPPRVDRLEAAVFPPSRPARAIAATQKKRRRKAS